MLLNEDSFSITQKVFPNFTRKIEVNLNSQKIKVFYKNWFQSQTYSVDLYEVEEDTHQVSKYSKTWLSFIIGLLTYSLVSFLVGLLFFVQKQSFFWGYVSLFLGAMGALLACVCGYFRKRFNCLVYLSRYNQQEVFSLFNNISDKASLNEFVLRLRNVLMDFRRGRDLALMMKQMPTEILLDEFRTTYIGELLKRGLDVVQLLESLNAQFLPETQLSVSGQSVH